MGIGSKSSGDIHFSSCIYVIVSEYITISMTIIYVIVALFVASSILKTELSNGTSSLVYAQLALVTCGVAL